MENYAIMHILGSVAPPVPIELLACACSSVFDHVCFYQTMCVSTSCEANAYGGFIRNCFALGSNILTE